MGTLSHLDELEAEAIYIMREVAAECEKPVMLYSIGKDSSVMLHLAMKAFYPEKPPFPFMHIDTTWKFKEMIKFRDETAKKYGLEMIEYINEDGVKQGVNPFDSGAAYTDIMKTQALKQALNKYGFTAAFGGGRRDEEKSRAKERIFSFRNENQAWDPKNQRPEMWKLYNFHTSGRWFLGSHACSLFLKEKILSLALDFSSSRRPPPNAAVNPYFVSACFNACVFMMSV